MSSEHNEGAVSDQEKEPAGVSPPAEAVEHLPRASGAAATLGELLDDQEDLVQAHTDNDSNEDCDPRRPLWKCLGPGLITGAADDDPSGIGTYSVAGAQFGNSMLWLVPVSIPLMIAVQEMCGRIGIVTGKGLAAVIKEHYPRWLLFSAVLLLIGANVINIYADLNVMAASAKMVFHGSFAVWLAGITALIAITQVLMPYRSYVRILKWLCLSLLAYVVVGLMPGVHIHWDQVAHHLFIPSFSRDPAFLLTIVGFLGTTISPYLFFWQAGEEVEDEIAAGKADRPGHRTQRASTQEVRNARVDTVVGMVASQLITFFIVVTCAVTLRGHPDINTAQDAARALLPLGPAAYWLFMLGIFGSGLLAIPTLAGSAAYGVAEAAGWRYGLYRRFRRARKFYLTLAGMIVAGYLLNFVHSLSPIKGLLYSAALNGIVAPPLIVVLLFICNNRRVMGNRTNGRWSNVLGWLAALIMGGTAAFLLWAMATGKAS
jgi:NRAMP (natural resistance-associated macrophage protein)-like metal ion transporter